MFQDIRRESRPSAPTQRAGIRSSAQLSKSRNAPTTIHPSPRQKVSRSLASLKPISPPTRLVVIICLPVATQLNPRKLQQHQIDLKRRYSFSSPTVPRSPSPTPPRSFSHRIQLFRCENVRLTRNGVRVSILAVIAEPAGRLHGGGRARVLIFALNAFLEIPTRYQLDAREVVGDDLALGFASISK